MAKDILSEFGPDADKPQAPRATRGGVLVDRDVLNYKAPQGPIGQGHESPGLGGYNVGNCGSQGKYDSVGGKYMIVADGGAGRPGDLNTEPKKPGGTQRG